MKNYALIGEKLGHSVSQPIHEAIFRVLGIEGTYRLIELPRSELTAAVPRLMDTLDGFNVTIPYKQDVMPLLASIDPQAASIGAVNTVCCRQSAGFNTDAAGFSRMLLRHHLNPEGQQTFILGSGGTAKTVRHCLHQMGAAQVTTVSRRPEGAGQISYGDFYEIFPQTGGLIVNATSAGMWPRKSIDDICAIHPDKLDSMLRHATGVADVVYNPPETFLTQAAARLGLPWCTGLYMLIEQAVQAEAIWQGHPMPEGLTDALMQELTLI